MLRSVDTSEPAGPLVRIAAEACLRLGRRGYECTSCVTACPVAAISFAERSFRLAESCLACGRCAVACPSEALAVRGFEPATLADSQLRIECGRVPEASLSPGTLAVPCLGGLGVNFLLEIYDATGRPLVVVDRGWCGGCAAGGVDADDWKARTAEASVLLQACDVPVAHGPQLICDPLPAHQARPLPFDGLKRRGLFAAIRDRIAPAAEPVRAVRLPDGSAPAARPVLHRRRLQLLARISARPGRRLPRGLFPRLIVSSACDDSGLCAALCPTAALRRVQSTERSVLVFHAEDCVACGRCQAVCPDNAIRVEPRGGDTSGPMTVAEHALAECQCGARFVARPGKNLCARCRASCQLLRSAAPLFRGPAQSGENVNNDYSTEGRKA